MPPRGTRPTSDRVREALFNVLDARLDVDRIVVLDLYAGSGALGLEAISRGASRAVFVEQDERAARTISGNIAELGVGAATEVRRGPVATVVAGGVDRAVDLVLADPPYDLPDSEVEELLAALDARGWTREGTVAVIERRASGRELTWPSGWSPWPSRRYGDTRLDIAQREPPTGNLRRNDDRR
ncbi:16S rRNA (guanine(966)-N(2))-methyltransferase RsmD [Mycolicibacterium doricum]|uniref:16S rRNA (Guanine(966)-N(2))-methyltransferase RsmD n=1 Tax=Mycolicibacterium doricum TaxID=126673 RepID=A0A1X1TFU7_9MYCO|nr:16S rRNA (guanine(966)-N(2))-methyltransferase RsmD [Mycolicibacterium doricum]BBZ07163.1 16S rRNA (guanine(966)-N(2))-methyltransferase RsmD [Mycolicibacterium doricum]